MAIIIPANTLSTGGYDVDNSCRFNDGDSPRMHKTPGSAGNLTTWTLSMWVKRSTLGGEQLVAHGYADSSNQTEIMFEDNNSFTFRNKSSGSFDIQKNTNMKFTDISAWYNIIIVNKASAQKLFINGVQPTYNTDVTGSYSTTWNNANENAIGSRTGGGSHFDGYICEVVFLDGTAVDDATSFGEFDEDSPTIWKPIDVSGLTFGTNGFYLDMKDSANLGNDANGGTDLTEVNLAATDQSTDTCTNNFCTWNSIADNLDVTLSEGNTKVVHGTALARRPVISTFGVSAGKWYWEWVAEGSPTAANMEIGIVNYASPSTQGTYLGQSLQGDADFTTYIGNGYINMSGSSADSGTAYAGGDVVGVAVDMDNTLIYFYKNNTLVNSGGTNFSGMEDGSGFIFMSNADRSGSASYTAGVNFGGSSGFTISSAASDANGYGNFEYAPPTGFLALCTKNLGSDGG